MESDPSRTWTKGAAQRWLQWLDRALHLSNRWGEIVERCKYWKIVEGEECPGEVVGMAAPKSSPGNPREGMPFSSVSHKIYTMDEDYWTVRGALAAHLHGFDQIGMEIHEFCPTLYEAVEKPLARIRTFIYVAENSKELATLPQCKHFMSSLAEIRAEVGQITAIGGEPRELASPIVRHKRGSPELTNSAGVLDGRLQSDDDEEEDEFCGWESLKQRMFEDDELACEYGVHLGPVLREAGGEEVAGLIDGLIVYFRQVWKRCLALPDTKEGGRPVDLCSIGDGCKLIEEVHQLHGLWFRIFNSLREAEQWFYRQFGPGEDTELLDDIADSLHAVFDAIDEMRSVPPGWEYLADEDQIIAESLEQLHQTARELAEIAARGQENGPAADTGDVPSPKLPKLGPHDRQAWQLCTLKGWPQQRIADELNKEHGTSYGQGQVSRMIRRAEAHSEGSGLAELVPDPAKPPVSVDPARLELGQRTDGRATDGRRSKRDAKDE